MADDRKRLDRVVKRSFWIGFALILLTFAVGILQLWLYGTLFCSTCPYGPHFTLGLWAIVIVVVLMVVYRKFFREE